MIENIKKRTFQFTVNSCTVRFTNDSYSNTSKDFYLHILHKEPRFFCLSYTSMTFFFNSSLLNEKYCLQNEAIPVTILPKRFFFFLYEDNGVWVGTFGNDNDRSVSLPSILISAVYKPQCCVSIISTHTHHMFTSHPTCLPLLNLDHLFTIYISSLPTYTTV